MNEQDSLLGVIRTLLKWKWPIIGVTALAAIAAVIVSLLLPNYYESSSIFYPTNPSITDRQGLFGSEKSQNDQGFFGTKQDVARMISLANSSPLKGELIAKFNLMEHYDIDPQDPLADFKVMREFDSNYKAIKTELGGILISMIDRDAELAAKIVNTAVAKIDKRNNEEMVNIKFKILEVFRNKVQEKQQEVDELTDSLATLTNRYDISAKVRGDDIIYSGTDPKKVEIFKVLQKLQESAVDELNQYKMLYSQYDASTQENISSVYIVEMAYPSVKKVKPVRWLICVTTTLVALFVSIIGALFIEKLRDIRSQL